MIHVLDGSNVPSVAKIIKIPGSGTGVPDTTPPAQVTGLIVTTVSSTQLNLGWTANTEPDLNHYNVYQGTTTGFTVTPGTTPPTATPGTNSFADTGLNPSSTYYYRVAAVDNAGNIGTLSSEQSGTTINPIFYNVAPPGDGYAILKGGIGSTVRYGEEPLGSNSLLVGKSIKSLKVRLRKRGTPSGTVNARIRRNTDDAIMATFSQTVQAQNLSTSFSDITYSLTVPYTLSSTDRILIEYSGPNGVDMEVWLSDQFDGASTRRVRFTDRYIYEPTQDIVATMSSE
jgi:Fibronectin type III domain